MKRFIFHYVLLVATITLTSISNIETAQAQKLPDVVLSSWIEPYKRQIWTSQGLLTLVVLGAGGLFLTSSKGGGSTSISDQDKTKKMFAPEEFLNLPAGSCVFINPAYANQQEASIPMKLKVNVGEGELKRRAYGESKFDLVIKQLRRNVQHPQITGNDIQLRISVLDSFIPKNGKTRKEICVDAAKKLVSKNPLFQKRE